MQVSQLSRAPVALYELWDREVVATVTQHLGAHGYYSAAVVAVYMDSPLRVYSYDGYTPDTQGFRNERRAIMRQWIADTLKHIGTGTQLATGTYSEATLLQELGDGEEEV